MRKFLVSYGFRVGYGALNEVTEVTEEIELNCKDSLKDGNLAKFIFNYLVSIYTSVILYNFWEIIEQENKDETN